MQWEIFEERYLDLIPWGGGEGGSGERKKDCEVN